MGYYGKIKEREKAKELRKKGLSYGEILKQVKVSKDSLSRWCRDIELTEKQIERLCKRAEDGRFRSRKIVGARRKAERRERIKNLMEEGKREVGKLNLRERFMAGIGLYTGDGLKGFQSVGFSNSNHKAINFMMDWFREFCQISENQFRGQIWIHDNQDERKAREFWSRITNIPLTQFHKSYIAKNKPNSNKIRKQQHKYGVFAIRVSSAKVQRRILGWMTGILENKIVK